MSSPAASFSSDWLAFGADRPRGWLATFDGNTLGVSGESAFALASTAHNPHLTIHFDGLLYNREELIQVLGLQEQGPILSSAELISLAFERWGAEFLDKVHGVFAVLVLDRSQGTLLAARDPMGIFPLFYTVKGDTWYFSTSLDILRSTPSGKTDINRAFLTSWISFVWPSPNHTAYDAVYRVRSGYLLRVRGNRGREERYWDLVQRIETKGWVTSEETEYFLELLQSLVARYLEIGPAGIYLSGGLDSVSVAAFAVEETQRLSIAPPRALSVEFPAESANESDVQQAVARQLGMPQWLQPLNHLAGPRGTVRESLDVASIFESPTTNLWLAAYMNLGAKAVRNGCRVLLTGGGGDEWLGVTPVYAADLMLKRDLAGIARLLASYHRSFNLSPLATWRNVMWRYSLRPMLGDQAARYVARFAPGWLAQRHKRDLMASFPDWLATDPDLRIDLDRQLDAFLASRQEHRYDTTPYLRDLVLGLDHPLTSLEHETVFEEGRRLGAILLSPFLDSRMVDFLARTPPELLNRGGRSKGLVRDALNKQFPELGFERQKKVGFGAFHETSVFQGVFSSWQELGSAKALGSLGIVSESGVADAAQQLADGDKGQMLPWQMHYLLFLESWTRRHLA